MCMGAPDAPTVPERQEAATPKRKPSVGGADDAVSRRRGYASMIATTSAGDLAPVSTTAGAAKQNLGA